LLLASCASPSKPPASSKPVSPSPPNLCWARGRPKPPSPPPAKAIFCNGFDEKEVARVEKRLRKEFEIRERPSKLVIDFGCDEASSDFREVFFEDGSGHGGSLRLVRFRREGQRIAVREIRSRHYDDKGLQILAGETDAPAFDALVDRARVALLAKPHLVRLRPPDGSLGLGGWSFSSADFHLRMSIVDGQGNLTERRFSGYGGSGSQEVSLPMGIASEPVQKLLGAMALSPVAIRDDDRQWFTTRLLRTVAHDPAWWVLERFVADAAVLGTLDAVPALATLAAAPGDNARLRDASLEAIAAITGWDPRKARTPEEAARAAVRECTVVSEAAAVK
jgi:hypothetical protein